MPAADVLLHVLLTLAAIIVLGRLLARLLRPLGQPAVIGEILAGILLGPSLLGPHTAVLLPPPAAAGLGLVAQLGVILYMFLVGLESNAGFLRGQLRRSLLISAAGMLLPFLLGGALAFGLQAQWKEPGVPLAQFACFFGVALAVTAFPVLARILADRGLQATPLGAMALGCAAAGDVAAWCALALLIAATRAGVAWPVLLGTLAFGAAMWLLVRPAAARWAARLAEPVGARAIAMAVVACLLAAASTQWIGIHALFGAFLMGLVIPHDSSLAQALDRRLNDIVSIVFLPAFFAYSGLRTQIDLLDSAGDWALVALIVALATLGKFGGVAAAARGLGYGWREAAALGALMNTRGLVELIVLNVGLDLGVISAKLYSMLVLMALVTTLATAPLLRLLKVGRA